MQPNISMTVIRPLIIISFVCHRGLNHLVILASCHANLILFRLQHDFQPPCCHAYDNSDCLVLQIIQYLFIFAKHLVIHNGSKWWRSKEKCQLYFSVVNVTRFVRGLFLVTSFFMHGACQRCCGHFMNHPKYGLENDYSDEQITLFLRKKAYRHCLSSILCYRWLFPYIG